MTAHEFGCRISRIRTKNGGADIRIFESRRLTSSAPNSDAVSLAEGVVERLRDGRSIAVAVVEVYPGGNVGTAWSAGEHYHYLNSGAARLHARLSNS